MDTLLNTPREGRLSFLEISTVSELRICSIPPISDRLIPPMNTIRTLAKRGTTKWWIPYRIVAGRVLFVYTDFRL